MRDGLASETVYAVTQDHKGFLWIATDNGVNRFDGNNFEHFTVDDGLGDNEIFQIFEDKYRRIWFLSFNGRLSYFQNGKIFNESTAPFLKETYCGQSIIGVVEDKLGKLWMNSSGNYVIMIDNEKSRLYNFTDSVTRLGINIHFTNQDSIEFRSGNKIFLLDTISGEIKFLKHGNYRFFMPRYSFSETKHKFFFGNEGILKMNNQFEQLIVKLPSSKNELFFTSIYYEESGNLWIGTLDEGVLQYKSTHSDFEFVKSHLPGLQVNQIQKDNEGNLWFSTSDQGLYMLGANNRNRFIFNDSKSLATTNLFSVYTDSLNRIWTGGDKGFLICIDQNAQTLKNIKLDFHDNKNFRINDLTKDRDGNLLIATNDEFFKVNATGNIEILKSTNRLSGPRAVKGITITKEGDIYAAFYAGLLKFNKIENAFDLLNNQGYPTRTFAVHAMGNRVFVANINGLYEYVENRSMPLYHTDKRLAYRISCLNSLYENTLIIGTNGAGVFLYKNNKISGVLNMDSGLPSNEIRSIFTNKNDIWIATDKGIASFIYENDVLNIKKIYTVQSKIVGNDIKDIFIKDSVLYAATSSGLVLLNTKVVETIRKPLKVFITHFVVNNLLVPHDSTLCLNYYQNNISISFKAISLSSPKLVEYQYKFDGNDFWSKTKSNDLLLTQLPPGTHQFIVQSRVAGQPWGPQAVLNFEINKPFWQTISFRIAMLSMLVLLVSLLIVILLKRGVRKKSRELDKLEAINLERQRISFDLHDDLGSSFTSIGMNTEIVKQKYASGLNFERELHDIEESARYANEKMSDIIWALSDADNNLPGLAAYINEFISDFEIRTGVNCVKKIQPNLPSNKLRPLVRKNIFLTVKEAFHNITKHSKANKVNFELFIADEILCISIHDNGIGFGSEEIKENSLGITSMNMRFNEIGGELIFLPAENEGTTLFLRCHVGKLI